MEPIEAKRMMVLEASKMLMFMQQISHSGWQHEENMNENESRLDMCQPMQFQAPSAARHVQAMMANDMAATSAGQRTMCKVDIRKSGIKEMYT